MTNGHEQKTVYFTLLRVKKMITTIAVKIEFTWSANTVTHVHVHVCSKKHNAIVIFVSEVVK